jgi:hypothetical protein
MVCVKKLLLNCVKEKAMMHGITMQKCRGAQIAGEYVKRNTGDM